MMMMMATTTTSNGVGGSTTPSMNQPFEDANEDEYFPGFTTTPTKRLRRIRTPHRHVLGRRDKKQCFSCSAPGSIRRRSRRKGIVDFDDAEYIAHFKNPEALKKASGHRRRPQRKVQGEIQRKNRVGLLTRQAINRQSQPTAKLLLLLLERVRERIDIVRSIPPPEIFELRRKKKP